MTSELTIARAARDHRTAEEVEAQLRNAVLSGDDSVSAADLAAAEASTRHAALRVEAARRFAAEEAEADRVGRIAELRAALKGEAASDYRDVLRSFDAAVGAVASFVAVASEHNDRLRGTVHELVMSSLAPLPSNIVVQGDDVRVDGTTLSPLPVVRLLAEVSYRAAVKAGVEPPAGVVQAAGLASDRVSAELFGVGTRHDGAQLPYGHTDRMRWLLGQLTATTSEVAR